MTTLNSHFGTDDDLKQLAQALHDRDMVGLQGPLGELHFLTSALVVDG